MDLSQAKQLIEEIQLHHPEAEIWEGYLTWKPSEVTSMFVGYAYTDSTKTDLGFEIIYTLPPMTHLARDKKLDKILSKAQKKITIPRGIYLDAEDGQTGLLVALRKNTPPDFRSLEQFIDYERELALLGMSTWQYFSTLEANRKFGFEL